MKTVIAVLTTFLLITVYDFLPAYGQSANQTGRTNPDQWLSHQMNQPAPSASDRDDISNDRLEEIKQLYMQAKRESENKPASENKTPNPVNHQMR